MNFTKIQANNRLALNIWEKVTRLVKMETQLHHNKAYSQISLFTISHNWWAVLCRLLNVSQQTKIVGSQTVIYFVFKVHVTYFLRQKRWSHSWKARTGDPTAKMTSKESHYSVTVYLHSNSVYFNHFSYCEVFSRRSAHFLFEITRHFVAIDINTHDVPGVPVETTGKPTNDESRLFFCINNLTTGRLVETCILGEPLFNLRLKCRKKLSSIKKFGKGILYQDCLLY